jgi:hypothetical protein
MTFDKRQSVPNKFSIIEFTAEIFKIRLDEEDDMGVRKNDEKKVLIFRRSEI